MHLWNDYEGTTLAGKWQLGRLLRTEGRSALFSTTSVPANGGGGGSSVLRLTEALNDQAVLQARYRAIQAAGDQYLVGIQGYGDALLDGTPLSYAVLEPTQESLADILAARRLSAEETMEVATSVAGGLRGLHAQGLVHGLVEPESVLAAGDRIKLRSDCARPAPSPEDAALEGAITPQTDAFGLAGVIYQSLTLNRLHDAADALALPEPFATVVRHAARGAWGVPEVQAELERYSRAHAPVVPPAAAAPATVETPRLVVPAAQAASAPATAKPVVVGRPAEPGLLSTRAKAAPPIEEERAWKQPEPLASGRGRGVLIGLGVALVLLALLYGVFHGSPKPAAPIRAAQPSEAVPPQVASPSASTVEPAPAATPVPRRSAAGAQPPHAAPATTVTPAPIEAAPLAGQKVWRVIVFTYNRRGPAEAKAASLNRHYPGFDAQVWSRTGDRPFLVTLGSGMTEQQAFALRSRARAAGLARDLYAQNYTH